MQGDNPRRGEGPVIPKGRVLGEGAHPPSYNFDSSGNLSFGISDYTDFPDQKYDPDIGIFGMDVNVVLERPGHRVSRRRRRKSKVSMPHRVGREESKAWFTEKFELKIVEE